MFLNTLSVATFLLGSSYMYQPLTSHHNLISTFQLDLKTLVIIIFSRGLISFLKENIDSKIVYGFQNNPNCTTQQKKIIFQYVCLLSISEQT